MPHPILEHWCRELIEPILCHPDTEEIAVNKAATEYDPRPTKVWVKSRREGRWIGYYSDLTYNDLSNLMHELAVSKGVRFGPDQPWLSETLPGGHRFSGIDGRNTRYETDAEGGIAIAIRQHAPTERAAAANILAKMDRVDVETDAPDRALAELEPEYQRIAEDIRARGKGVLLIGSTDTGKTYRLKQLLATLSPLYRYLVVEDTREIPPTHPNTVFLMEPRATATRAGWARIVEFLSRGTGDVLVIGELSEILAARVPSLATIGHRSVMTTMHADTAEEGIHRFFQLAREGGSSISEDRFYGLIQSLFGHIVVLKRDPATNRRTIKDITTPEAVLARMGVLPRAPGEGTAP